MNNLTLMQNASTILWYASMGSEKRMQRDFYARNITSKWTF